MAAAEGIRIHLRPSNYNEVQRAAFSGDLQHLQLAIEQHPEQLNEANGGLTPLGLAVVCGQHAATRALIAAGANMKAAEEELHAAGATHPDQLAALLAARQHVAATTSRLSALHNACLLGDAPAAEALLAAGADANAAVAEGSFAGLTPLMLAAEEGHEQCLSALLGSGAALDLEACTDRGRTALMLVAREGHEGCIASLAEAGADVRATDATGTTALMLAAHHGHPGCVAALAALGAEVQAANSEGFDALKMAAVAGHPACVQELLLAGAPLEAVMPRTGCTALILAAHEGHEGCLLALAAAGANLEARSIKGGNALVWAAAEGHLPCVRVLLALGADTAPCDSTAGACRRGCSVPCLGWARLQAAAGL